MSSLEIKITEQKAQPLLERTEINAILSYESETPSRAALRKKAAEQLKVPEERVFVGRMMPVFGEKQSRITVHVYQKKEDAAKYEPTVNVRRNEGRKKQGEESVPVSEATPQTVPEKKKSSKDADKGREKA